ncbi:MAG: hypothetical protein KI790_16600 [Cyclobacteriaceae bacterium]|nr:hypothetical protein [Cyclobacteriaceae bacterium HetDA_MAG_MS6]
MSKKKVWSGVLPLTILIAMIGGIFLLGRIGANQDATVKQKGLESVATTIDEGGKRMIQVSYTVDGRTLTKGTGKPFSHIQPNEQFKIKYLKDDPESMVVFFDRPHISDEHEYTETLCSSISKTLSVVNFTYQVDGRTFNRETLYRNQQLNTSKYKVLYRTKNPEIGYLVER